MTEDRFAKVRNAFKDADELTRVQRIGRAALETLFLRTGEEKPTFQDQAWAVINALAEAGYRFERRE